MLDAPRRRYIQRFERQAASFAYNFRCSLAVFSFVIKDSRSSDLFDLIYLAFLLNAPHISLPRTFIG